MIYFKNYKKFTKERSILSTVLLVSLFSMTLFFNIDIDNSLAYWEDDDDNCMGAHGTGEINASFVSNIDITIDGVENESSWGVATDYIVPTAAKMGDPGINFFVSYIHIKIIHDNDDLYVRMYWNDTAQTSFQDGITVCWNINVEDFSVSMLLENGGMQTANEGEFVDNWIWVYNNMYSNMSSYSAWDQSFGNDGWLERDDETQDLETAYTYGDWLEVGKNNYMIEMKRPLKTNDADKDVQFIENGAYELSFAVLNDVGGEDHASSWTWQVNFSELPKNSINGYNLFILIPLVGVCILFYLNQFKKEIN